MRKIQPFKTSQGYGDGSQYEAGEVFHLEAMRKSQNGLIPGWSIQPGFDSTQYSGLGSINFFAQVIGGNVFGIDTNGHIYQNVGGTWSLIYSPGTNVLGNGLFGDQKGNLLYAGSRYVGRFQPSVSNVTAG